MSDRRIRLERTAYSQAGAICSVTITTRGRALVFASAPVAKAAVAVLTERANRGQVPVYGYCVMPDHVHLVLGPSSTCDIISFVGQFKNLTQRAAWRLGVSGAFWQARFWDHFLRRDEDVEVAVSYVLNNPVRRGLVEQWSDYPFGGSWVFPLRTRATGGSSKPIPRAAPPAAGHVIEAAPTQER